MPHFQVVTCDGDVLGAIELWPTGAGTPNWPIGSVIHIGGDQEMRVTDTLAPDDPELFEILFVEPADLEPEPELEPED